MFDWVLVTPLIKNNDFVVTAWLDTKTVSLKNK